MARPKDIGTAGETALVRAIRTRGFSHAERRSLRGNDDCGDVTGTPGIVWEVKGGEHAKTASDSQIAAWLAETETERHNASADFGILVVQRRGIGRPNAHRWWAVLTVSTLLWLCEAGVTGPVDLVPDLDMPVRIAVEDACYLLRHAGYGTPVEEVTA